MVLSVVIYFKLLMLLIQCVPFLMSNAQQLGGGLFRDNKLQFHRLHAVHAASIRSLALAFARSSSLRSALFGGNATHSGRQRAGWAAVSQGLLRATHHLLPAPRRRAL